jgi:hypothetical protein
VLSGLEVVDADRFEACEELADAAVVLDPWAGAFDLLCGQSSGDGLAG